MSNSSRIIRPVAFDQYYSPQKLAKYVKTLVVDILDGRNETLCVDPCAGNNILYDVLPEPKTRFDIADKKNPVDFLTTNRSTFNLKKETHLAFVMNPPFLMPKQKNGVIKFLNHASTLMHDDEFIICVSPHSMRKWTILSNVSKDLHLEEEHVFEKPLAFACGHKQHRVRVLLQVWKKYTNKIRIWPIIISSSLDFRVAYDIGADFYIKVWGSIKRLGMISNTVTREEPRRYVTSVGTLAKSKKGGTCIGIFVKPKASKATVKKRFQDLFDTGAWRQFMTYKFSGNNNPMVTSKQIYTLYENGLTYLKKESYGIKVKLL